MHSQIPDPHDARRRKILGWALVSAGSLAILGCMAGLMTGALQEHWAAAVGLLLAGVVLLAIGGYLLAGLKWSPLDLLQW